MAEWGYDPSQPIIVWDEGQAVIDGHTRIKAAQEAGIADIPVHYKSFDTEDEPLDFTDPEIKMGYMKLRQRARELARQRKADHGE